MKYLTTKEKIEKLERKLDKIHNKLIKLIDIEKAEERKKAFDLIIELGQEHGLFYNIERVVESYHDTGVTRVKIEMILPR